MAEFLSLVGLFPNKIKAVDSVDIHDRGLVAVYCVTPVAMFIERTVPSIAQHTMPYFYAWIAFAAVLGVIPPMVSSIIPHTAPLWLHLTLFFSVVTSVVAEEEARLLLIGVSRWADTLLIGSRVLSTIMTVLAAGTVLDIAPIPCLVVTILVGWSLYASFWAAEITGKVVFARWNGPAELRVVGTLISLLCAALPVHFRGTLLGHLALLLPAGALAVPVVLIAIKTLPAIVALNSTYFNVVQIVGGIGGKTTPTNPIVFRTLVYARLVLAPLPCAGIVVWALLDTKLLCSMPALPALLSGLLLFQLSMRSFTWAYDGFALGWLALLDLLAWSGAVLMIAAPSYPIAALVLGQVAVAIVLLGGVSTGARGAKIL